MKLPLILCVLCLSIFQAAPAALTNDSIIKMSNAGLDEETIILAIRKGDNNFDTSVEALLELKKANVSQKVIRMMINPAAGAAPSGSAATAAKGSGTPEKWSDKSGIREERAYVSHEGKTELMQYASPGMKANLFSGQVYATLDGASAQLIMTDRKPSFEVIMPSSVQARSMILIGRFATKNNAARVIMIGNAFSMSQNLPKDRNVVFLCDRPDDQTGVPDGYVAYSIKPADPLVSGEYALMISYDAHPSMPKSSTSLKVWFYDFSVR